MFVAKMFVSEEAAAKLARRGITTYDVEQLPKNGALSKRNPRSSAAEQLREVSRIAREQGVSPGKVAQHLIEQALAARRRP